MAFTLTKWVFYGIMKCLFAVKKALFKANSPNRLYFYKLGFYRNGVPFLIFLDPEKYTISQGARGGRDPRSSGCPMLLSCRGNHEQDLHRHPRLQGKGAQPRPLGRRQEAGARVARTVAGGAERGRGRRRPPSRRHRQGAGPLGRRHDGLLGRRGVWLARGRRGAQDPLPGRRHADAVRAVHQRPGLRSSRRGQAAQAARQHGDLRRS